MMSNKKQQLLDFLDANLFIPINYSSDVSEQVRESFNGIHDTLTTLTPEGIINFFWNTLGSSEIRPVISHCLMEEGIDDYNDVVSDFKMAFTSDWLNA